MWFCKSEEQKRMEQMSKDITDLKNEVKKVRSLIRTTQEKIQKSQEQIETCNQTLIEEYLPLLLSLQGSDISAIVAKAQSQPPTQGNDSSQPPALCYVE